MCVGVTLWFDCGGVVSVRRLKHFSHMPMKMEPIVSSETSAIRTQTPGNYPERNKLQVTSSWSLFTQLSR